MSDRQAVLSAYVDAAEDLVELIGRIPDDAWDRPGLGEWNVRQLAGHAARTAFSTIGDYLVPALSAGAEGARAPDGTDLLADDDAIRLVAAYYLFTRDNAVLHAGVADRGREAALDMAADPAGAARIMADAAIGAVRDAPDTAVFVTRFGAIGFAGYLLTRIVELVVHSLDIAAASGLVYRPGAEAERLVTAVVAESARRRGEGPVVIRALAGRGDLPPGFNVFG